MNQSKKLLERVVADASIEQILEDVRRERVIGEAVRRNTIRANTPATETARACLVQIPRTVGVR